MAINPISANDLNVLSSLNSKTTSKKTDKDMFMTLLVAQLKNQDPLDPQNGAEFVAQLTQFNSLDQLVGIRQNLDQLIANTQKES